MRTQRVERPRPATSAPSLFISYSRQEAPFVDCLLGELEARGFRVWMDYHSLTPARPWLEEIHRGIEGADTALVVVSRKALASEYARMEWRKALELNKRVILVIFEAARLPPELEPCEWVDFRGTFGRAMGELLRRLESPAGAGREAPPQGGFKAPPVVWLSFAASLLLAPFTLTTFWTVYLPYYLLPLPGRILRRDYNFFHVQLALLLLPAALLISGGVLVEVREMVRGAEAHEPLPRLVIFWMLSFVASVVLAPLLLLLLRSRAMGRWGRPVASRPAFANPQRPGGGRPRPVTFAIDAAPEDAGYAEDLAESLEKYGHRYAGDGRGAEVAFVLISAYKKGTAYDPEERVVYPVWLQTTAGVDARLQRIQWIDFRRGLKNLDALARLLPEPARIFKALGIAPVGEQTVMPPVVRSLVIYQIILGILTAGSWLVSAFQLRADITPPNAALQLLSLAAFLGAIFYTVRSLINRAGPVASPGRLALVLVFVLGPSVTLLVICVLYSKIVIGDADDGTLGATMVWSWVAYVAGLLLTGLLALRHRGDLRRWLPRKAARRPASTLFR